MNGSPEIANSPRQDKPPESRLSFYLLRLQCIQLMQNSIDKSANKYQTNTKQISNEYQTNIKQMPYLHRICRIWRRLSLYLLRTHSMQSILWMQTNFNKNKYKTNIMEGQIDLMAKVYFWFDWCQQGQYISLIIHLLTISPEKKHNAPGSGFKWQKMIQAQFISSWWHWLQVFNWKGGNEDPNRKVVLRENKWHYVVILLKRNKTKTSLNTWGFQQKKKENEKPNVWTSVSFEPVGSANKRTSWQYQIQFLFQRYLCKRKTSTIHDDECRCSEVQMTFFMKDKP